MKLLMPATALALVLIGCTGIDVKAADPATNNEASADGKTFEAYGWMLVQEKNLAGIDFNAPERELFLAGFLAGSRNQSAPFDLAKIYPEIDRVAVARRQKLVEATRHKNRAESDAFFQQLSGNTNVIPLNDGVACEILKKGDGGAPKLGDTVNAHFTGHLINGTEFYQMGPMDMVLVTNREVCRGWLTALRKIGPGGALKLYVPPPLSEEDAARFGIEPDSAMIFDVELLAVKATSPQDLADATASLPPAPAPPVQTLYTDAQVIQTWGWVMAQEAHLAKLDLNQDEMDSLTKGLGAGIRGQPATPDLQKLFPQVESFMAGRREQAQRLVEQKHLAANQAFFDRLKQNQHVIQLPDGLCYEILQPGSGPFPKPAQTVNVRYTGRLTDGAIFDSTQLGPLDIDLDKVIPGWSEGLQKINRGGKIKLYIPPSLGYKGEATSGIPSNSILIFEIELLEIKDR